MPDPDHLTISATQSPALFGQSPYFTRWMLYQHFAKGMSLDGGEDSRMIWGKKLQPLIIEHAAAELKLEVRPNEGDVYHRRGKLGCTRDATIICPDRGPGALETKCVFDYRVWMTDWLGGKAPPKNHEIQLQQQMLVGDGDEGRSYDWGIIAAWVCGDVYYFERKPIEKLWFHLVENAIVFFDDVRLGHEPDPFGVPVELPWLNELFPVDLEKVIDLSEHPDGPQIAEAATQYHLAKQQESAGAREAEPLRAKLLAVAKDAADVILPEGMRVRIRPHGKGKRVTVFIPEATQPIPEDILSAG